LFLSGLCDFYRGLSPEEKCFDKENFMRSNIIAAFITIASVSVVTLRAQSGNAVDAQKLKDAASQGFGLNVGPAVSASVRVEAVLLPARVCSRLFGKEIANNYAAVELTISNKNAEAEFLVHSVFMDYSQWLLGYRLTTEPLVSFQASTLDNQVASVEYRVARGEAQDAQLWSSRNWTIRALTLLGVLATGSEFAFKEQGITKAIGAFTGQVVPAAGTFWPDGAQPQLDRISDFGFRTNKVIPKASSDIIVAFFPIDRFITPGLKKLYLKSPAVFFLPALGPLDPKVPAEFTDILNKLNDGKQLTFTEILTDPKKKELLDKISMNRIRIVVGGTMAVDVDTIPARVDSVTFDDKTDWTKQGTVEGTINGALLSTGKPQTEETGLNPTAVSDGSSDTDLHFTMSVPRDMSGCTVHFHVVKTKDDKSVDSNHYAYTAPGTKVADCPAPAKQPASKK
jgi:hypothetical protein